MGWGAECPMCGRLVARERCPQCGRAKGFYRERTHKGPLGIFCNACDRGHTHVRCEYCGCEVEAAALKPPATVWLGWAVAAVALAVLLWVLFAVVL